MALMITEDCINCSICVAECPNTAIARGDEIYIINPNHCTECVGHYTVSQCVDICPVDCIVFDPNRIENKMQLHEKFIALAAI